MRNEKSTMRLITTPMQVQTKRISALGLVAICFGFFLVILDTSVVNVALPMIGQELQGSLQGLQWIVNGYTLVFASLLLSAGTFGDLLGHKRAFLLGFLLFTGTSLLCSLAPSLSLLIAARALQGVGPALLVPGSLSLITHGFLDQRKRARAIGIWAGSSGIALASGPVIGGVLVETLGWRSIFLLNVPIGVLAIMLTLRYVAETPRRSGRHLDLWGQGCAILALATLTYALIEGRQDGWTSSRILVTLATCGATILCFLLIERKQTEPMLPLQVFASSTLSATLSIGCVVNFGLYGVLFVLSLFLQEVYHYPAVQAGIAFLPLTLATGGNALLSGRITARFGARRPMLIGLATGSLGTLLLVFAAIQGNMFLLVVGEILIGSGSGMTVPAMTSTILNVAPKSQVGLSSALLNASRQLGSVLGVAIAGSLLNSLSESASLLMGIRSALLLIASVFFLGCVLTHLYVQREM
jgi:DHA2 family methylenomycin A resistance protein-like MFS transporter